MAGIFWPSDSSDGGRPAAMRRRRSSSSGNGGSSSRRPGTNAGPPGQEVVDEFCRAAQRGDAAAMVKLMESDRRLTADGVAPSRIPLVHGAAKNQWKVLRFLLERKAKPNVLNSNGQAALHIAADRGFADSVSVLLNFGADPRLVDRGGRTALDLAKAKNREAVCIVLETWPLLKKMQKRLQPMQQKANARTKDVEAVRMFLAEFGKKKAEIDKDIFGGGSSVGSEGSGGQANRTKSSIGPGVLVAGAADKPSAATKRQQ